MGKQTTTTTRRIRARACCSLAAAATLLSSATTHAFTTTATTSRATTTQQTIPIFHQPPRTATTALHAVTDPITLLGEDFVAKLEEANKKKRYDDAAAIKIQMEQTFRASPDENEEKQPRVQFHGITTTASSRAGGSKKPLTRPSRSTATKSKKSVIPTGRSSTMPGYSSMTGNQQTTEKQLKMLEDATGVVFDQPSLQQRKSRNGEAMYIKSLCVPDSMVAFANELHNQERITPTQELELGRKTQEAIRLQSLYDNLETNLMREPTDDELCAAAGKLNMEALRQTIEDGMEAKNKLVTSNLRMVQGVVNVYIRNGLGGQYNAGDMMQEGIMALIRAAEKFEPQRGFRFSTYAMYWIRSAVKRSQTYQSRVITVPQRLHANHKKVKLSQGQLQQELGRLPTPAELAQSVEMSEAQLERCLKAMDQRCFSLDQQITNRNKPNSANGRDDTLHDIISNKEVNDSGGDDSRRIFLREDLIESLYRALDRESAHMILLRYGLVEPHILPRGYEGPLTIAQVSQLLGMKPDKVRRRILKSLKELKYSIGNEWKDFERVVGE